MSAAAEICSSSAASNGSKCPVRRRSRSSRVCVVSISGSSIIGGYQAGQKRFHANLIAWRLFTIFDQYDFIAGLIEANFIHQDSHQPQSAAAVKALAGAVEKGVRPRDVEAGSLVGHFHLQPLGRD